MPRKFVYGPGLPGYGTKGADGSTGLQGVATYFSAYDGNADTVTIKSKIIANKELFSTDKDLPNGRSYQTGDLFIDKNARVFQIDIGGGGNLYSDTGIFLNTSGFFTTGPPQSNSPGFQRYSNAWDSQKFLIDTVYTNSVGDYTGYPDDLYISVAGSDPTYFARANYIGSDVAAADLNGWYPFDVWTTDINEGGLNPGNNAIALAREPNANAWHFGNWTSGPTGSYPINSSLGVRESSLFLDFKELWLLSYANTSNSFLQVDSDGKVFLGTPAAGMGWTGDNTVGNIGFYAGAISIQNDDDFRWDNSSKELELTGNIAFNSGATRSITWNGTGGSHLVINANAGSVTGGNLYLRGGSKGTGSDGQVRIGDSNTSEVLLMAPEVFVANNGGPSSENWLGFASAYGDALVMPEGGDDLILQGGPGSLGGDLRLRGGDGTSTDGDVIIGDGTTDRIKINASRIQSVSPLTSGFKGILYLNSGSGAVNIERISIDDINGFGPVTSYTNGGSNRLITSTGTSGITGETYIEAFTRTIQFKGGAALIETEDGGSSYHMSIESGNGADGAAGSGAGGNGGNGSPGGYRSDKANHGGDGGDGANSTVSGTDGGDGGNGANGGVFQVNGTNNWARGGAGGDGGDVSGAADEENGGEPGNGGTGGAVNLYSGDGGPGGNGGSASGDGGSGIGGDGGDAGNFTFIAGDGGDGGDAGTINGGSSYDSASGGDGGDGGYFHFTPGNGGSGGAGDPAGSSGADGKFYVSGDIIASGNITAYGTVPSDISLKKDIKDIHNPLEDILKLRPISYILKDDNSEHYGLIAQELEKVLPKIVQETELLKDGKEVDHDNIYKSIRYDELIPHLIGAIQEQQKRIESLERKIEELIK